MSTLTHCGSQPSRPCACKRELLLSVWVASRRRNDNEYPSPHTPPMSAGHATEVDQSRHAMLQDVKRLLDSGTLDPVYAQN